MNEWKCIFLKGALINFMPFSLNNIHGVELLLPLFAPVKIETFGAIIVWNKIYSIDYFRSMRRFFSSSSLFFGRAKVDRIKITAVDS